MSVKFKYPRGHKSLDEVEKNLKATLENKVEPRTPQIPPDDSKLSTAKDGFVRLVDFIKLNFLEKKKKKPPEELKRTQAINAYKKIKEAS